MVPASALISIAFYIGPLMHQSGPTKTTTPTFTPTPIPATATHTPGMCPGDLNLNGAVTVDEVIQVINRLLNGCP